MTNNDVEAAKDAYKKASEASENNERILALIEFDKLRANLSPREVKELEKALEQVRADNHKRNSQR